MIKDDPFDRIALNKLLRQSTKGSEYEPDPFTADERAALVKACRPDEALMLTFWFNTGLRPGELFAVRAGKFDPSSRRIKIDTNQVAGIEKAPKTSAGNRLVDLNEAACESVRMQIAQKSLGANDHLWPNPRTGKPWSTDSQLRKTFWVPLCERSGVRYRNPYQVRHTYASAELTAQANPWYIAQQLGHAGVEMVFRVYGKWISADYLRSGPREA